MIGEAVQHPRHYQHPSGVECIDIIRHYTCDIANAMKYLWRAGLKAEEGMTMREKEIEDCRKAVWYLEDYLLHGSGGHFYHIRSLPHPSGISRMAITQYYCEDIAEAFRLLWHVGLVIDGVVVRIKDEDEHVRSAITSIRAHIDMLKMLNIYFLCFFSIWSFAYFAF